MAPSHHSSTIVEAISYGLAPWGSTVQGSQRPFGPGGSSTKATMRPSSTGATCTESRTPLAIR